MPLDRIDTALRYTRASDAGDDLHCLYNQNLDIYRDVTKQMQSYE